MPRTRLLDLIERAGNRLPEPAALFVLGSLAIMLLSQLAVTLEWQVTRSGSPANGARLTAVSLLDADGLWWITSHLVENFISFPPLGIVLTGMLGIGLAERSGLISALLRRATASLSGPLLSPCVLFLGILSSLGLDAGYVVLPPLAAAMYQAAGRSPLAGIAVSFAGVSAGFSANLMITAIDPLVAGFSQSAAQLIDGEYRVAVTANWWFMIVSTFVLCLAGWLVTARFVEPRLAAESAFADAPAQPQAPGYDRESRGLRAAAAVFVGTALLTLAAILVPGAPLSGDGDHFPRWVEVTVPLVLILFFLPGLAFGLASGTIRSSHDVARMLAETMASLGPYIVLAFFAAQFIAMFKQSNLGPMLAIVAGEALAANRLPATALVLAFVVVTAVGNLFVGSMSAKYALFAPVFVPMLMIAGVSPELTQAAYRVGDSITNIITPLNPYFVIILGLVKHYAPRSGIGTVVAMMLPYALCFWLVWSALLLAWMNLGLELGPGGGLSYPR